MKKPFSSQSFRVWVVLVFSTGLLLYFIENTKIELIEFQNQQAKLQQQQLENNSYFWPEQMARKLQVELNGGTSPGGVIDRNFGYGVRDDVDGGPYRSYGLAVIQETTKPYKVSSDNVEGELPIVPQDFLEEIKENGSGRMAWQITPDQSYAAAGLTYWYGNVEGFVVVAHPATFEEPQYIQHEPAELIYGWVAISVISALLLTEYTRRTKQANISNKA